MDVRLPDGTIIKGVPDGMSKADLTAKLAANDLLLRSLLSIAAKTPKMSRPLLIKRLATYKAPRHACAKRMTQHINTRQTSPLKAA